MDSETETETAVDLVTPRRQDDPRIPAALNEALTGETLVLVGLRDSSQLLVKSAKIDKRRVGFQTQMPDGWIHLTLCGKDELPEKMLTSAQLWGGGLSGSAAFPKGIDVRLSEIAWASAAPFGD